MKYYDLNKYVARERGKSRDVDGAYGAQCWDQMSQYMQWLGVPKWQTYTNVGGWSPHPGWACNVRHHAKAAGLGKWFRLRSGKVKPKPGWIVFWDKGDAAYPKSHVATVLADLGGGRLRCLTQNPGPTDVRVLPKSKVLGYLQPRATIKYNGKYYRSGTVKPAPKPKPTPKRRENNQMMIIRCKDALGPKKRAWAVVGPGYWYVTTSRKEIVNYKAQWGITVDTITVKKSTWNNQRAAAMASMTPEGVKAMTARENKLSGGK